MMDHKAELDNLYEEIEELATSGAITYEAQQSLLSKVTDIGSAIFADLHEHEYLTEQEARSDERAETSEAVQAAFREAGPEDERFTEWRRSVAEPWRTLASAIPS